LHITAEQLERLGASATRAERFAPVITRALSGRGPSEAAYFLALLFVHTGKLAICFDTLERLTPGDVERYALRWKRKECSTSAHLDEVVALPRLAALMTGSPRVGEAHRRLLNLARVVIGTPAALADMTGEAA
jgi:hypothetical protein